MNTRTNTSADEGSSSDFARGGALLRAPPFSPFSLALRTRARARIFTLHPPAIIPFRHRVSSLLPGRYSRLSWRLEDVDMRDAIEKWDWQSAIRDHRRRLWLLGSK